MRISYPLSAALMLALLSGCDQHGGIMPVDGQKLLSTFNGPKIQTMEESQIELAKGAEKSGNFAQASSIYQQLLDKDDENAELAFLLAESTRKNGEYDKAITIYDKIIGKDPNNISAKEGKGLALLSKGDFESPTSLFQEVLRADNKRWKSLNGMGILFVTRNLPSDGIKYFEEALRQSPNNISVMNNLGLSQALNKQYDKSLNMLAQASSISTIGSTERKRIDLNQALVYASAGKLDEARKISEVYLSGPALKNNLGLYAHLAKDDGLAKSYLNMALTESKTYYGKAWDNLETLNTRQDSKKSPAPTTDKGADASADKKAAKDKKKNSSQKTSSKQEPSSEKADGKSLGNIISQEIKTDGGNGAVVKTIPTETVQNAPATEHAPAAGTTAVSAGSPVNSLEKSLGTIKVAPPATAKKADIVDVMQPSNDTAPATPPAPAKQPAQ